MWMIIKTWLHKCFTSFSHFDFLLYTLKDEFHKITKDIWNKRDDKLTRKNL